MTYGYGNRKPRYKVKLVHDEHFILLTCSRLFLLWNYIWINDTTVVLVLKLLKVLIVDKALYERDQSTDNQAGWINHLVSVKFKSNFS